MKTETLMLNEEISNIESQTNEQDSALRQLQDAELMLIGGGGGDVVFG